MDITDHEVRNVALAGLCHDLGHGPFSHVFDNHFIRGLQRKAFNSAAEVNGQQAFWTHEEASVMMLTDLIETHPTLAEQVTEQDIKDVCNLILGKKRYSGGEQRPWLFDIVSNSRSGVDVDKFDYLSRDSKKMNVNHCTFSRDRVMRGARVVSDQVCYAEEHEFDLKLLYDSRYNLHHDCYQHKTVQALECLTSDILTETDGVLYNYLEAIRDPKQYIQLDDSLLSEVRMSTEPELAKARQLLERFDSRQIYSCVGEKGLSPEVAAKAGTVTEADIINHARDSGDLRPEDIVVRRFSINMGMKDRNPLGGVSFHRLGKDGRYERFSRPPSEMSTMMPEKCQSNAIRLFVKDESKFALASNAFRQYCAEKLGGEPHVTRHFSHSQQQQSQVAHLSQSQS